MPDLRKSAREQSGLCVLVRELVHVHVCAEGLQERPGPGPAPPSSCDSPGWSQLLGLFSWRFPPPAAWTRRSLPPGCPPGRPPVGLAQGGRGLSCRGALGTVPGLTALASQGRRAQTQSGGLCGAARTLGSTAPPTPSAEPRPAQLGCSARLVAGPFSPQSPPG